MVGSDWVDLRDPNVIAENELLQAAASIEAAAKKLSELQPRRLVVCPYMEWGDACVGGGRMLIVILWLPPVAG